MRKRLTVQSLRTVTAAEITAGSGVVHGDLVPVGPSAIDRLLVALNVTSHHYGDADEHYQFNLVSAFLLPSGSYAYWDLGGFIDVTGADAVVCDLMFINGESNTPTTVIANATVTSEASNMQLSTDRDTRGAITTAVVRHGFIGDFLSWTLEGTGTTAGPITFEILGLIWTN